MVSKSGDKLNKPQFNRKSVYELFLKESRYITDIWKKLPFQRRDEDSEDKPANQKGKGILRFDTTKLRAKSMEELHQRLEEMKGRRKGYKEKLLKKNLKNRLTKKKKKENRNMKKTLIKVNKEDPNIKLKSPNSKPVKPVFNSEGKMVFSKFDFRESGTRTNDVLNKKEKELRDPQKQLQKLEKQKEKFKELEDEGQMEVVREIKKSIAWQTALQRASGLKVKDNPELLKKTLKKQADRKKQSRKKWQDREENLQKKMKEKQQKRTTNIAERNKQKKLNKMKKAVKKGRFIPGLTKL